GRERHLPRHRRLPRRTPHRRLPDAQAGLRPALRHLRGHPREGREATAGLARAHPGRRPVRAARGREMTAVPGHGTIGAPGRVALVGGGPGPLDLLTVRALRLLRAADVVIADRLGPAAEIRAELRPGALVIDVGKTPGHHPVPQQRISALLVEHARAGRSVVRLKGGDPFVPGRGGEELLACREAGIEVEVVPGISSVLAVPQAAGIPVTHRGTSASVHVVSGHDAAGPCGPSAATLAALADEAVTTVVLMGV